MIIRHATDEVISTDLRGMSGGRCHALGIQRRLRNGGEEDLCGRVHQIKDLHRRRRSTCHPRERRVVHVWLGFDKKHLRVVRARGIHPHHLCTYSPYGQVTAKGDGTQPVQWSGEVYDAELGLVYYNYRYYHSLDGRWTRRDEFLNYSGLMSTLL